MTKLLELPSHSSYPALFYAEMLGNVMILSEALREQFLFLKSWVTCLNLVHTALWLLVTLWPPQSVLGPSQMKGMERRE